MLRPGAFATGDAANPLFRTGGTGHLGCRAGVDEPPALEDQGPGAEGLAAAEEVRRHQHGGAARAEPFEDSVDEEEARRIEVAIRLVEEDDARVLLQHAGEREPLAHSGREGPDGIVRAVGETDLVEQREKSFARRALSQEARHDLEVLERGERLVEVRVVVEERDRLAHLVAIVLGVAPEDANGSAIGPDCGRERPEQRRFSRPVPAGDHHQGSFGNLEGDVDKGPPAPVATTHSLGGDGDHPAAS